MIVLEFCLDFVTVPGTLPEVPELGVVDG